MSKRIRRWRTTPSPPASKQSTFAKQFWKVRNGPKIEKLRILQFSPNQIADTQIQICKYKLQIKNQNARVLKQEVGPWLCVGRQSTRQHCKLSCNTETECDIVSDLEITDFVEMTKAETPPTRLKQSRCCRLPHLLELEQTHVTYNKISNESCNKTSASRRASVLG